MVRSEQAGRAAALASCSCAAAGDVLAEALLPLRLTSTANAGIAKGTEWLRRRRKPEEKEGEEREKKKREDLRIVPETL